MYHHIKPYTVKPVNTYYSALLSKDIKSISMNQVLRGLGSIKQWEVHYLGRITSSIIHNVKTKVHKFLGKTGQSVDAISLVNKWL